MDEEWECVFVAGGETHAQQVRAFLESAGIEVVTRGEALRHTHGLTVDGLGSVKIVVPASDVQQARELIASAEAGNFRLDDVDPASAVTRLERCLEALAATGTEQQSLFPDEELSPGALAAQFDRAASTAQRIATGELTAEQADAIDSVSDKLLTMSRDGADFDADLWTEGAVQTSTHWREVRSLAAAALQALRHRV
jgi:hypothetical protein